MSPAIRTVSSGVHFDNNLLARLPKVRGRLTANAPLGHLTWFGVGGPAEVMFRPADREDLAAFLSVLDADIPLTVLGVASNVIIRDGGIPGMVIRLGREFAEISATDDLVVTAGAAALDMNVALLCAEREITGLEFLSGIPGSIGGALRMNAGAYGRETKDALIAASYMTRKGEILRVEAADMGLSYRHCGLPSDVIFLEASFTGGRGERRAIEERMTEIKNARSASQPIRTKTGGSTFANPAVPEGTNLKDVLKAWQLIDAAGGRGLKLGGAQMSDMHANFMINTGQATAADLERLGEKIRGMVVDHSGVMLRWEIKRIGLPLAGDEDLLALAQQ